MWLLSDGILYVWIGHMSTIKMYFKVDQHILWYKHFDVVNNIWITTFTKQIETAIYLKEKGVIYIVD